jgi:hypothetical protein
MNWKRFLLIALVASGFAFASVPRSDAGVSVGIGFGFPVAYPYPYPYYPYPYGYYGSTVVVGRPFFWHNGHRVFVARHPRHFRRFHR